MLSTSAPGVNWEAMWSRGLRPGQAFDAARVEPALQALIDTNVLPEGPALVPGCGRGYAVAALAANGRETLGLDISPTAVEAANAYLATVTPPRGITVAASTARVVVGDFFKTHPAENRFRYGVGYDCTFLCAIPPDMREEWARAWRMLIRPGGELVTLLFPLRPEGGGDIADDDPGPGPPFIISLKLAAQLLEQEDFVLISHENVPSQELARGAMSGEIIARWRAPPIS